MSDVPVSERERMLLGEPYNTRDPELLALAHHARALVARFASLPSTDRHGRHGVLLDLLATVGEGVWIEPPFFCDYGRHISIGADTFVNANCVFLDSALIRIGANVLIAPGVQLLTATHPLDAGDRIVPPAEREDGMGPFRTHAQPIIIGDNVWIGAGTIVGPGVTIGNNTTIGAGSLVLTDIPANCLAFGQPCKVQRELAPAVRS
jgi:maltose O-acetyltransferase